MHRLGLAEINGELGLSKRPREGVKWLKRAAELADQVDPPQPQSLHELAVLHEKGIENVVFQVSGVCAALASLVPARSLGMLVLLLSPGDRLDPMSSTLTILSLS